MNDPIPPKEEKVPSESVWRAFFNGILATGQLLLMFIVWSGKMIWRFIIWISDVVGKKMTKKNNK